MVTSASTTSVDTQPLLLDVSNTTLTVTPEQFDRLCIDNPDLRLELSPSRELIVMPPAFFISGERNGDLTLNHRNRPPQTARFASIVVKSCQGLY